MQEFDIINKYFKGLCCDENIVVDIGDDAAVIDIKNLSHLAITSDMLLAGVHFFADAPASSIGYKALAVNLSDLAAMGATPKWFTLSIALPEYNHDWLSGFVQGMSLIANKCNIKLIGGDLCRGSLAISITAFGEYQNQNNIVTRSGAMPGDGIFITGDLGLPSVILEYIKKHEVLPESLEEKLDYNKLYYPTPRCDISKILANHATAMIDISDGLIADLQHIMDKSQVSANIRIENLPVSEIIKNIQPVIPFDRLYQHVLCGGDEYELLFTAALERKEFFMNNNLGVPVTLIGEVEHSKTSNNIKIIDGHKKDIYSEFIDKGWQHFS